MARETDARDAVGPLAFVDTETTSLDPHTGEVWEVAVVRRDPDGSEQSYEARWYPDLRHADPMSLAMNGFYDRVPPDRQPRDRADYGSTGHEWQHTGLTDIAERIRVLTDGASLVGMVPGFDEVRLRRFLRGWNVVPTWHYQPVDVEILIAGHLGVQPTYDSGDLSRALGIDPDDYPRHTAMGDVRWTIACYDALFDLDGQTFVAVDPAGPEGEVVSGRVRYSDDRVEVYVDGRRLEGVTSVTVEETPSEPPRPTAEIVDDLRNQIDRLVDLVPIQGTTLHGDLRAVQSTVSYLATRFDEVTEDEPENPNGESTPADLDPFDESLPLVVRLRALAARIPREDTAALVDEAADVVGAMDDAIRDLTSTNDEGREIDVDSLDAAYRILRQHSGLAGSAVVTNLPGTYDRLRTVVLDACVYLRDAGAHGPDLDEARRG